MKTFRANGTAPVNRIQYVILPVLLLALLLAACASQTAQPATPTAETAALPADTPTPLPEPSPTALPGKALLVAPQGSGDDAVASLLAEQAGQAELTFETASDLQPDALLQEVKLVVLLAAPANLNELLVAAPQAQFVVVSDADLQSAPNLSVIRRKPENQAFAAGFISVLLSKDWRAAGLIASDGPLGEGLQDAFVNGGRYFCGTCAPGWPLGVYYPLTAALPSAVDGPSWQAAAADLFDNQKVEVFYIAPEAARTEITGYLQGKQQLNGAVRLLGTQSPPTGLQEQWAATIRFNVAEPLSELLPDLLAGTGGAVVDAPLELENVNSQLLGEGRMRLVDELLAEMEAGRVYPLSIPAE